MPHSTPFRFCPRCATPLVLRDDHGTRRRTCPACGYVHYRNPAPAAGVLIHEHGRVLLVKRRFEPAVGAWCIPAGFIEYGETPRHCAVRELAEETGLRCRLGPLFGVYAGFDDPRVRAILVLYLARVTGGSITPGDDAIAARWFRIARLPRDIAFEAHRQALAELAAHLRATEPH
jgi:8-oxo-dGTP diphosphatase